MRLENSGQTYTLTDWNDTVWTYTTSEPFAGSTLFLVTSIKDRNGYTRNVQYSTCVGNCLAQYYISSVTDSYGRTLTFGYDQGETSWVTSVTTPTMGR